MVVNYGIIGGNQMKRVHWHWTAGAEGLIGIEADSYHEIIQPDGKVQPGTWPPEANRSPIKAGRYAAHTLSANSDAIGISCDAMAGAQERPLKWGSNPLTEAQIESMLQRTAHFCRLYGIPVGRQTTLSHAEVERNLGIKQKNKWDFTVLPGMTATSDAIEVGDKLRARLSKILGEPAKTINKEIEPAIPETDKVCIKTSGSPLNLRRWPSINDNIIGAIANGTIVPVQRRGTFDGRKWLCVNSGGIEGWIVEDFTVTA